MLLPLASYELEATASSQRLVNVFLEKSPDGAQNPYILRRSPGVAPFATPGSGPGRGLVSHAGSLYAVSGNSLYRVSSSGTSTAYSGVSGTDAVSLVSNGTQLYLNSGHIFDGSLRAITDGDYIPGGKAAFLDSYIVMTWPGTGKFVSSDLANAETYDALYFATAEGLPDNLVTLEVDHRQVVLIGEVSTEIWDNVGGSGYPFVRSPNGFLEIGGVARYGVTKQDQSVFWLANDRTIRRLTGNTGVRVSQHGFERRCREYSDLSGVQMFSYTLDGHLCVVLRVPDVATWIYDATTQQLHERQTYGREDWDVSGIAEAYGKVFVQRASDGAIGVLTKDVYTEFGDALVSSWTYQNLKVPQGATIDRLELGIETGVGLTTGQGSDPRISLDISYDGGRIYSALPNRSMGMKGRYLDRVHWDRLGYGRDIVFRASLSDPVPLTVWNTEVTVR